MRDYMTSYDPSRASFGGHHPEDGRGTMGTMNLLPSALLKRALDSASLWGVPELLEASLSKIVHIDQSGRLRTEFETADRQAHGGEARKKKVINAVRAPLSGLPCCSLCKATNDRLEMRRVRSIRIV